MKGTGTFFVSHLRRRTRQTLIAARGVALGVGLVITVTAAACGCSSKPASPKATSSADHFGWSTAVSGSTLVVGAPFKNSEAGAAYVFVRSRGRWSQQAELTAKNAVPGGFFGFSVAISGSTAVVGASPLGPRTRPTGAAYVFVRSRGKWSQQAELTAQNAAAGDQFGDAVALSGSTPVVGATGKNSEAGAAYVFVRSGGKWSQQAELTASDAAAGDQFGSDVGISGSEPVKLNETSGCLCGLW